MGWMIQSKCDKIPYIKLLSLTIHIKAFGMTGLQFMIAERARAIQGFKKVN
jgi:hypothetical protein